MVENMIDNIIKEMPRIIGTYVHPNIIPSDVVHKSAPIGLDIITAISFPLTKPINVIKLPPKNKVTIKTIVFLIFVYIYLATKYFTIWVKCIWIMRNST